MHFSRNIDSFPVFAANLISGSSSLYNLSTFWKCYHNHFPCIMKLTKDIPHGKNPIEMARRGQAWRINQEQCTWINDVLLLFASLGLTRAKQYSSQGAISLWPFPEQNPTTEWYFIQCSVAWVCCYSKLKLIWTLSSKLWKPHFITLTWVPVPISFYCKAPVTQKQKNYLRHKQLIKQKSILYFLAPEWKTWRRYLQCWFSLFLIRWSEGHW